MHEQAVSEGGGAQALDKGCAVAGACAVVQFEIVTVAGQLLSHAQQGRDADATGEQQAAPGALSQREQVARGADAQAVASLHLLVKAA
ncbi:hypothetical protein D3C81_1497470 [compost metagenome]